ncbi:MAG: InlB B-repeat-containing protein [Crenarchaeota archaeon]|nr:InlB B-repeat-containing protein [Thermoproteota archaeon]
MKKRFSILILILCLITALTLSACNKGTDNTDNTTGTENTETETGGETGDENQTVTYTITFESNGGSAVTAITAVAGATVTAPAAPTKAGYIFVGWYSDSGLNTSYTFGTMPSGNITVYAKWTAEPTEAEYKAMCEEKLINVAKDYAKSQSMTLENIKLETINKENGTYYISGDLDGVQSFITIQLKSVVRNNFNQINYEKLNESISDLNYNNIYKYNVEQKISSKVTSSSYNNFLDSVVTDEDFQSTLSNAGISLPITINGWEDIATVVNAKIFDDGNIDITFVDLSEYKTVTVRVYAHLTLVETSSVENQVYYTTHIDESFWHDNRTFTIVSSTDFLTFPSVG